MATITYRGEYQWLARIRRAGYPEQTKTFITKVEAEAWVRKVEGKMDRGVFVDKSNLEKTKLITLLERYEIEITPTKRGAIKEKSKIKIFKNCYLAGVALSKIEPADIVEYRDSRIKEVSSETVIKEMNLLSNIFNVARSEWGYKGLSNPVQGVRRPKAARGRNRRIKSWEEIERIIAATQSPTLKVLIPLALETTMRRSEMVNVSINDIDFDRRTIALYEGKTKNGEPRIVPLSTSAIKILRSHKPEADGQMFPVTPGAVTQAFQRALHRARAIYEEECRVTGKSPDKHFLTNLRLHDMRHEATSRLFEDTDLREFEIMAITGHKDTRQLKRYTHLRAANLAKRLG